MHTDIKGQVAILDPMLHEVAASGIFVSTHPDIILKLGTKEVVYRTRSIGWGCDTHLYRNSDDLRREMPPRLATGEARVPVCITRRPSRSSRP